MSDDFEKFPRRGRLPRRPAMTDYGTANISGRAGGHSGPPLHRGFVSDTNMENGFENVRVQAERRAGPREQVPKCGDMSDVMRRQSM